MKDAFKGKVHREAARPRRTRTRTSEDACVNEDGARLECEGTQEQFGAMDELAWITRLFLEEEWTKLPTI